MLAEQVYQDVREDITSSRYPPGAMLVEKEIAGKYGVSRGTAREALQRLSAEGRLTNLPRKGYQVSLLTRDDIEKIQRLRLSVESLALSVVVDAAADEQLRAFFPLLQSPPGEGGEYTTMNARSSPGAGKAHRRPLHCGDLAVALGRADHHPVLPPDGCRLRRPGVSRGDSYGAAPARPRFCGGVPEERPVPLTMREREIAMQLPRIFIQLAPRGEGGTLKAMDVFCRLTGFPVPEGGALCAVQESTVGIPFCPVEGDFRFWDDLGEIPAERLPDPPRASFVVTSSFRAWARHGGGHLLFLPDSAKGIAGGLHLQPLL